MIQSGVFWLFLAASLLSFWLLPVRMRIGFLGVVSAAYLMAMAPWSAGPFLVWAIVFYLAAPLAIRRRTVDQGSASDEALAGQSHVGGTLTLAPAAPPAAPPAARAIARSYPAALPLLILSVLVYLMAFKYLPEILATFFGKGTPTALVPLGISYFTFKLIHYAIEVARQNVPDHSFWQYLCYLFLFPTITAGPIERFDHFLANQQSHWTPNMMVDGLYRIGHGLIKKFVFADMLLLGLYQKAAAVALNGSTHPPRTFPLWGLGIAAYLFLYLDFAGYSDIAIGVSRLFGLRIMENFNWPFLAPNIGAFWKRWHMTLAGWCQSYIYMPVLGWRRSSYLALYATFVVIGLWHAVAVNWLIWGLYHATGITIYQAWTRAKRRNGWTGVDRLPWKYLAVPITFLFVAAGEIVTVAGQQSSYTSLCVLAKLLFIKLPAP